MAKKQTTEQRRKELEKEIERRGGKGNPKAAGFVKELEKLNRESKKEQTSTAPPESEQPKGSQPTGGNRSLADLQAREKELMEERRALKKKPSEKNRKRIEEIDREIHPIRNAIAQGGGSLEGNDDDFKEEAPEAPPAQPGTPPDGSILPNPNDSVSTGVSPKNVEAAGTYDDAVKMLDNLLAKGKEFGQDFGNRHFAEGSRGRVKEELSQSEQDAESEARKLLDRAGVRSQEEQAQADALKNLFNTAGNRTPEMYDVFNRLRNAADEANRLSPLELEAIETARRALPGLNSVENTALREAAREEMQRGYLTQQRELERAQSRNQVRGAAGAAQMRQLGQDQFKASRGLERDLLVENIKQKNFAQQAFTDLVSNRESDRFRRSGEAEGRFANTNLADVDQRARAQQAAGQTYSDYLGKLKETEGRERQDANRYFGDLTTRHGDTLRGLETTNLGYANEERQGRMNSELMGYGIYTGQPQSISGQLFQNQANDAALKANQDAIAALTKQISDYQAQLNEMLKKGQGAVA